MDNSKKRKRQTGKHFEYNFGPLLNKAVNDWRLSEDYRYIFLFLLVVSGRRAVEILEDGHIYSVHTDGKDRIKTYRHVSDEGLEIHLLCPKHHFNIALRKLRMMRDGRTEPKRALTENAVNDLLYSEDFEFKDLVTEYKTTFDRNFTIDVFRHVYTVIHVALADTGIHCTLGYIDAKYDE
jgi:hypothetical protein